VGKSGKQYKGNTQKRRNARNKKRGNGDGDANSNAKSSKRDHFRFHAA